MGEIIRCVLKTDTLILTECTDGYYLWDTIVGLNIAIHAKSEEQALIYGLTYYQRSHSELKKKYKELNHKIDSFLCQFWKDND